MILMVAGITAVNLLEPVAEAQHWQYQPTIDDICICCPFLGYNRHCYAYMIHVSAVLSGLKARTSPSRDSDPHPTFSTYDCSLIQEVG